MSFQPSLVVANVGYIRVKVITNQMFIDLPILCCGLAYLGSVCGALTCRGVILLLFQFRWGIASRWRIRAFETPEPNFTAETTSSSFPMYSERASAARTHQGLISADAALTHTSYIRRLVWPFIGLHARFHAFLHQSINTFRWDEGTSSVLSQLVIYPQHALMRLSSQVFWSSCINQTNRVK